MKKQSIIFGILLTFILMAVNAFPASLQFDFDGDEIWDSNWGMAAGDTVEVDVWLDGFTGSDLVTTVIYKFEWDPALIQIMDAWPYDTDHGGPSWSPSYSYAHVNSGGEYTYRVGSGPMVSEGIPVDNKIKLHTIIIKRLTDGNSEIATLNPEAFSGGIFLGPAGVQLDISPHAHTEIHAPLDCDLTINPVSGNVFTWETMQFSTTVDGICFDSDPAPSCYTWEISVQESTGSTIDDSGLYTAGGNEGTDIVTVTDTCNNDISNTATVNVEASTTTTSIPDTSSIPTTTTSILIVECETNAECDDGIFCNGVEQCKLAYAWSSNLAGSTGDPGNGLNRRCVSGNDPCSDDGIYCNGEDSCDEENDICLHSGDPCAGNPTDFVCDEDEDVCVGCMVDEDCDDGLFCNGVEICVDNVCQEGNDPCPDDDLYCSGIEDCDEDNDVCTKSGDPCPEGTTCFEPDECRPIAIPNILTEPDPVSQSRWIPLPVFLTITGQDGAIFGATSSVIFNPNAIWALPLVISEGEIIAMGLIMPQWLTGPIASEEVGDINVTVITGSQEATGTIEVQLLPFFLDEDKAILE